VIVAETLAPCGKRPRYRTAKTFAAFEFDPVPLAIIETERLDRFITFKCPCEARGGILAAGKQHQSATLSVFADHRETP
jgi:hypothetical protein